MRDWAQRQRKAAAALQKQACSRPMTSACGSEEKGSRLGCDAAVRAHSIGNLLSQLLCCRLGLMLEDVRHRHNVSQRLWSFVHLAREEQAGGGHHLQMAPKLGPPCTSQARQLTTRARSPPAAGHLLAACEPQVQRVAAASEYRFFDAPARTKRSFSSLLMSLFE